jgi:hypothetical protein
MELCFTVPLPSMAGLLTHTATGPSPVIPVHTLQTRSMQQFRLRTDVGGAHPIVVSHFDLVRSEPFWVWDSDRTDLARVARIQSTLSRHGEASLRERNRVDHVHTDTKTNDHL